MKTCPACAEDISSSDATCPHCGSLLQPTRPPVARAPAPIATRQVGAPQPAAKSRAPIYIGFVVMLVAGAGVTVWYLRGKATAAQPDQNPVASATAKRPHSPPPTKPNIPTARPTPTVARLPKTRPVAPPPSTVGTTSPSPPAPVVTPTAAATAPLTPADPATRRQAATINNAGMRHYKAERYAKAAAAFEKAFSLDPATEKFSYNRACVAGLMGQAEIAVLWLRRLHKMGTKWGKKYAKAAVTDKDFDRVRDAAPFKRFMLEARRAR